MNKNLQRNAQGTVLFFHVQLVHTVLLPSFPGLATEMIRKQLAHEVRSLTNLFVYAGRYIGSIKLMWNNIQGCLSGSKNIKTDLPLGFHVF